METNFSLTVRLCVSDFGRVFTSGVHLWYSCRTWSDLVMISPFAIISLATGSLSQLWSERTQRIFLSQCQNVSFFYPTSGRPALRGPVLFHGPPPLSNFQSIRLSVCLCVQTRVHLSCQSVCVSDTCSPLRAFSVCTVRKIRGVHTVCFSVHFLSGYPSVHFLSVFYLGYDLFPFVIFFLATGSLSWLWSKQTPHISLSEPVHMPKRNLSFFW
jgi:hypothetical protein